MKGGDLAKLMVTGRNIGFAPVYKTHTSIICTFVSDRSLE
jgi:hypothetical protein